MFITFEGSEGSGKSTQIDLLASFLRHKGLDVQTTREPGGTRIGEQVRECLHDVANKRMTAAAELLLYSASRAQIVQEVIRPALSSDRIVLSDRYADSSTAYQGYGRQLDLDILAQITYLATGGLEPDITIFLDVEPRQGLTRRSSGSQEMNRMDLQAIAFYERVRQGYMALIQAEPIRWETVDANRPVEDVHRDIRKKIALRLGIEP